MANNEHPLKALEKYLPPDTFLPVAAYLQQYKVHLTISRERTSILGNYRHAHQSRTHRISVNGTLNTYSFLITLLHELAHLLTFEQYKNRVQPHGREWKTLYGQLLAQFLERKIFPKDIADELLATLHNPGASSCAEESLMRILRNYDAQKENLLMVEQIPFNGLFKMKDGRLFRKKEQLRKRFKCEEVDTHKVYLFNPIFEVEPVESDTTNESTMTHQMAIVQPLDSHLKVIEQIPHHALFKIKDGRVFKKGERLRKRFKCQEVATRQYYLFGPKYPVEPL